MCCKCLWICVSFRSGGISSVISLKFSIYRDLKIKVSVYIGDLKIKVCKTTHQNVMFLHTIIARGCLFGSNVFSGVCNRSCMNITSLNVLNSGVFMWQNLDMNACLQTLHIQFFILDHAWERDFYCPWHTVDKIIKN